MDTGIYSEIPNETYHQGEGVSSSDLKEILKSPKKYRYAGPKKKTPSMILGTMIHEAILEPEKFLDKHVVAPAYRKGTKKWNEFAENNVGKHIIKSEEADIISGVSKSVLGHSIAKDLLRGGFPELSFYYDDPEFAGIKRKVRPDLLRKDGVIVDIKTTQSIAPDSFQRDAAKFKYHLSAAYYIDTVNAVFKQCGYGEFSEVKNFFIIAVETDAPFECVVYSMSEDMIERGREEYRKALQTLHACKGTDIWCGYADDEILPLELPYFYEYSTVR